MATQPPVKVIEQVSLMKKIAIGIALGLAGLAATGFFAVIGFTSPPSGETPEQRMKFTLQGCVQLINHCNALEASGNHLAAEICYEAACECIDGLGW